MASVTGDVITVDESKIRGHVDEVVRTSVEETLNGLLDAEAITAVGAEVRYLPAYSPDLNPIELAFSKFKKLLRDGAERTATKLEKLCGQVLDLFTEYECRNYIKHCGYRYC